MSRLARLRPRDAAVDADLGQGDLLVVKAVLAAGAAPTAALRELGHPLIREALGTLDAGQALERWLAEVDDDRLQRAPAAAALLRALAAAELLGAPAGPAVQAVLDGITAAERIRRLTAVRATQAVHSARFLLGLPPLAGVGLSVADPAVRQFWISGPGFVIALIAGSLVAVAMVWIRRLLASVALAVADLDPLVQAVPRSVRPAAALTVAAVGLILGGVVVAGVAAAAVWLVATPLRARLSTSRTSLDGSVAAEVVWTAVPRDSARHLPTVEGIELLALALAGSAPLPLACRVVARICPGPTGQTFGGIARRLALGEPPATAFPEPLAEVSALLDVTRRWGAPSAEALRVLAADLRVRAASAAEEAAERLAVRLVFPTTLLLVPAFGLLVVAPLAVSMLNGLALGL